MWGGQLEFVNKLRTEFQFWKSDLENLILSLNLAQKTTKNDFEICL